MSTRRRDHPDRSDHVDGAGPDEQPGQADPAGSADAPERGTAGGAGRRTSTEPVLPRSPDESDVGWGERGEDDEERLRREVPPHWA